MYKNIVVPIDVSDKQSLKAIIPPAVEFANTFSAALHLIHIIPHFGTKLIEDYLPKNWMNDQKEKYIGQLQTITNNHIPAGVRATYFVGRGAIYDEVINYSNKVNADLIIVSAVRPQLRDYMLGPNASKIVRHSSISVLVVREE